MRNLLLLLLMIIFVILKFQRANCSSECGGELVCVNPDQSDPWIHQECTLSCRVGLKLPNSMIPKFSHAL